MLIIVKPITRCNWLYCCDMRSVADDVRAERRRRLLRLTPAERFDLAFRIADEDLELLTAARGIPRDAARSAVRDSRTLGRRASRSAEG